MSTVIDHKFGLYTGRDVPVFALNHASASSDNNPIQPHSPPTRVLTYALYTALLTLYSTTTPGFPSPVMKWPAAT